ncbi:MAG TPA: hypothetical protein VGM44_04045 [Polyangiaceae bacterium]|jgi:hypothetical protein
MKNAPPAHDSRIKFRYLAAHDVLLIHVDWPIETLEDIADWTRAFQDYFARQDQGRKMDMIIELSKFSVATRVRAAFGEARAKVLKAYAGRSYRVNLDASARVAMYTSRVLHGAEANDFPTIDDALAQLKADRATSTGK